MWIFFAFGSAFFAGITAILAKIGVKNVNSNLATAIRTAVILIFSWLIVFLSGANRFIGDISGKALIFLILSGLCTGGSWLCYFKALQLGDVNKVTPIDKSSVILTLILSFVILGEKITLLKTAAIILIGAGTFLMITKKNSDDNNDKKSGKGWIFYGTLSAVFASLTSILGKLGIVDVDSNLGTAIRTVIVLIMAWLVVFVTHEQKDIKNIDRKSGIFITLSGITTGLSWLCYYRALQSGDASVVVPIDKLSILFTIGFSYFVLKEKLSFKAFCGLIAIVLGTMLMIIG